MCARFARWIDPVQLRHAADVGQFETGDVLTLAAEIVRRARTGPGVGGVVGKIKSGLRASDHVVTVVRIDAYFADGLILRKLTSGFRQRFNKAEFEFRIEKMMLLESIKPILTRQIIMDVEARFINEELVQFIEKNLKKYPGKSGLKFNILEPRSQARISLYTMGTGFEMNDEMSAFLERTPELEISVVT